MLDAAITTDRLSMDTANYDYTDQDYTAELRRKLGMQMCSARRVDRYHGIRRGWSLPGFCYVILPLGIRFSAANLTFSGYPAVSPGVDFNICLPALLAIEFSTLIWQFTVSDHRKGKHGLLKNTNVVFVRLRARIDCDVDGHTHRVDCK